MDSLIKILITYLICLGRRNMGRTFTILIILFCLLSANSQVIIDLNKFIIKQNDTVFLNTADFLNEINWLSIKQYSNKDNEHYAYETKDSLLTNYEYIQKGRKVYFKITSYNGKILEFIADSGGYSNQQKSTYFFDKNNWLNYVNEMLPTLDAQFKLTNDEPVIVLKSYYKLLGIGIKDEYGFICEYSTVGAATERRKAIIKLLIDSRIDLIKKLFNYPNLQTKIYAVDALIYYDYTIKQKILQFEKNIKKKGNQVLKLQKKKTEKSKLEILKTEIEISSDSIKKFSKALLTDLEWKIIYNLRDSKQNIKTCNNAGSYKIYEMPISELLSEKAITEIPKLYEKLKRLGYFF
jgi:hypothetical protein